MLQAWVPEFDEALPAMPYSLAAIIVGLESIYGTDARQFDLRHYVIHDLWFFMRITVKYGSWSKSIGFAVLSKCLSENAFHYLSP